MAHHGAPERALMPQGNWRDGCMPNTYMRDRKAIPLGEEEHEVLPTKDDECRGGEEMLAAKAAWWLSVLFKQRKQDQGSYRVTGGDTLINSPSIKA